MSLQHVLALEVKHHLHGKSSQEIGDLMQSLSNGELVALLKDFKVPYNHKRKRLKACEMIEEFKKHRQDGYPRLKRSLMTPAQRIAADREKETLEETRARQEADALRHGERRANETSEETRARQEADALRHGERRANETLEETRARQEADALRHGERRANETLEETRARQEADATAKDATALRIEKKVSVQFDDRLSALDSKYGFQGKSNVEVDSKLQSMPKGKLVALLNSIKVPCYPYYQELTVDGMIDVFKKQREGNYPLLWNDLMDEAKDASYRYYAKKQKRFEDATRRSASVKYENKEAKKKLLESLIGLKLNVPEHWWQGRRGIKKWKCVVESINLNDGNGRYFIIKCTEDEGNDDCYPMAYAAICAYADEEQDNFSSFDLPDVEL